MHIDRMPVYRAYQRAIDLELYHAFAELVVQTSQDNTAGRTYRQIKARQIWQPESDVFSYFEPYNLRYPGEVLERFEEKLGNDVRVLRALALALGNTCAIQSDNMFVGNQRGTFLQKVRRSAREDVYLQGALYLLETDTARRHSLLDELAAKIYVRTEEALFVLSLFDDTEYGYRAMHDQLLRLLTQNRTIFPTVDFGAFEWFIRFYGEQVKKYRGKADLALRTLMKLPYMNMKPDSREFLALRKAGYRHDEIVLANSLAVWADRLPDRLNSRSIPAEKIAVTCSRMLLNEPQNLSEGFYEYLGWLFRFYDSFSVKYEGFQGLWEAVQYGLNPTAPKTLLWMNQTIQKDFPYRFDVFDPQYDDLAKELERDTYMELFTLQMLYSRLLVSGVHDPVLSGATNRFLSENRKPIDRISLYQQPRLANKYYSCWSAIGSTAFTLPVCTETVSSFFPRKLSPRSLNTVASSKMRSSAHRSVESSSKSSRQRAGFLLLVKTMLKLPSLL